MCIRDRNPTYDGPLVLQDLDASAADSPDLDPSEVLANPSLYQGALAIDLAEDTGLLTLTPSSDTCYATIDVVIGNMRFESSQVDGLVLREKRAFLVDDEASPF